MVCGGRGVGTKLRPKASTLVSVGFSWWEERLLMALLLKFVWSSWRIWRLVFLKFLVVRVCGKSFLNEGMEYGRLGCAVLANFSEPSLRFFVDVCLERKEGILGGEAGVYSLPSGGNRDEDVKKVKLVYIGELLRMGDDSLKSVCPVDLVDRHG